MNRRHFVRAAPLAAAALVPGAARAASAAPGNPHVKLSCNLYSFNAPLRSGEMTLDQVVRFCSDLGFAAVDPTGYYFPGYPTAPDAAYAHQWKRRAFRLGLDISGTGVRNDFAVADAERRAADVALVERWVQFAARLDAPVLRVFAGRAVPPEQREEATAWVVDSLRRCAEHGAREGVMIVLQNHADFIRNADQLLHIVRAVDSPWFAVNLDIGSFPEGDPYEQIARVAPHAATWQIKENVHVGAREVPTDLERVLRIVRESGYRGYLPLETLGPGDPRAKVTRFLEQVRAALAAG